MFACYTIVTWEKKWLTTRNEDEIWTCCDEFEVIRWFGWSRTDAGGGIAISGGITQVCCCWGGGMIGANCCCCWDVTEWICCCWSDSIRRTGLGVPKIISEDSSESVSRFGGRLMMTSSLLISDFCSSGFVVEFAWRCWWWRRWWCRCCPNISKSILSLLIQTVIS